MAKLRRADSSRSSGAIFMKFGRAPATARTRILSSATLMGTAVGSPLARLDIDPAGGIPPRGKLGPLRADRHKKGCPVRPGWWRSGKDAGVCLLPGKKGNWTNSLGKKRSEPTADGRLEGDLGNYPSYWEFCFLKREGHSTLARDSLDPGGPNPV